MDTNKIIENILSPFDTLAKKYRIEYIEFLNGGEGNKSIFRKAYNIEFPYMSYDVLEKNLNFLGRGKDSAAHLEITSKYEHKIFCHIYPIKRASGITDILIVETETVPDKSIENIITYISYLIANFLGHTEKKFFIRKY